MNDTTKKGLIAVTVVILVLLVDQVTKIWVKTHMALYDMIHITDWFKIYFVENNGMAFGIEAIGKLFLSLFRIVAVGAIIVYLIRIIRGDYNSGLLPALHWCWRCLGNIIDSLFYGCIFQASYPGMLPHCPFRRGYASLLHGKVVDMFYFPLIEGTYPDWIPILGGKDFLFFRFIFNVADSAISVGVVLLLIFYRKTLSYSLLSKEDKERYDREKQEQPEKKIIRES